MKKNNNTQHCFIIEGNIGAGKSTFLKIIKQYFNVQTVIEPNEQWQNIGGEGHNILDLFYKDPKRWAYTFQSYAFVSRLMIQRAHARANPYSIQFLERSVFSDRYCFALNAYQLGYINALEWAMYGDWFSWLLSDYIVNIGGFIYLKASPEVCYARLKKRGRHEEKDILIDYIAQLHDKHEDWLIHKKGIDMSLSHIPVLVLNCDADFEHDKDEQEKHIERIGEFIVSHVSHTVGDELFSLNM